MNCADEKKNKPIITSNNFCDLRVTYFHEFGCPQLASNYESKTLGAGQGLSNFNPKDSSTKAPSKGSAVNPMGFSASKSLFLSHCLVANKPCSRGLSSDRDLSCTETAEKEGTSLMTTENLVICFVALFMAAVVFEIIRQLCKKRKAYQAGSVELVEE